MRGVPTLALQAVLAPALPMAAQQAVDPPAPATLAAQMAVAAPVAIALALAAHHHQLSLCNIQNRLKIEMASSNT